MPGGFFDAVDDSQRFQSGRYYPAILHLVEPVSQCADPQHIALLVVIQRFDNNRISPSVFQLGAFHEIACVVILQQTTALGTHDQRTVFISESTYDLSAVRRNRMRLEARQVVVVEVEAIVIRTDP